MKEELKKSNIYDTAIHIKISVEQKDAIEQIARLYDRSLSSYIRTLINDAMKVHEVDWYGTEITKSNNQ